MALRRGEHRHNVSKAMAINSKNVHESSFYLPRSWEREIYRVYSKRHQETKQVTNTQSVTADGCKPTCRVLVAGQQFTGKNGPVYAPGISAQSTGARKINLQIAAIPPGAWSKAHKHAGHETAIYVLSGEAGMWYGEKLEDHLVAGRRLCLCPRRYPSSALQSERCRLLCSNRCPHRSERAGKRGIAAGI